MTAAFDNDDRELLESEEDYDENCADSSSEPTMTVANCDAPVQSPLPWIGALADPRIGPMVVFNDSGYLVPLWTAGDLLRGCRYFWRA